MSPLKQDDETARDSINADFLKDIGISPIDPDELADMERNATNGAADDIAQKNGFYNPEDVSSSESAASTDKGDSKGAAKEAGRAGGLYNEEEYEPKGYVGKFLKSKKGKALAGGVGGGIVGLGMLGLFLLPLKVMHVADNLQSTFFSQSEDAVERMSSRLLASYLVQKVVPGMVGTCTTTKSVSKSCAVASDGDSPIAVLYNTWRDQNLEGKLADKYGLELRREGGRFYLRSDRLQEDIFNGDYDARNQAEFERKMFTAMSRAEVRSEFLRAIENETFYKRMMYRFKYGSLMERKYGVVRCVIACTYRNDRADKNEFRSIGRKAWVIDRVISPRNEALGLAFKCSLGGFDCVSEGSYETSEDGDRRSRFESDVRAAVGDAIGDGRMTQERVDELRTQIDDMRQKGVGGYYLDKLLVKGGLKAGSKFIPIVGQIDLVVQLAKGVENAGPAIKTLNYVVNSQAMVQAYMMYRTNADEIKTGQIDAEELGYVAGTFSDDFGDGQGGGGAESSAYYNDIMGTKSVSSALTPKAYASTSTCNDESNVTTGLCPEMMLTPQTAVGDITNIMSEIYKYAIKYNPATGFGIGVDAWSAASNAIFDALGSALDFIIPDDLISSVIPDSWEEWAGDIASSVGLWFANTAINNIVGDSDDGPSGARMFEMAAMGANVAANDYAHYGLGAGEISDEEANELRASRMIKEQEEFANQSLFAKLFDTSSKHSAITKIALATPAGKNPVQMFAANALNPAALIASTNVMQKADAATVENLDLGGVTQYGYRPNDPVFQVTDYEKFWEENSCDDEEKLAEWAESAKISDETGMPINENPYPCKIVETAAQINCGYYNDECLSPEDLGQTNEPSQTLGSSFRAATFNILHYPDGDWEARLRKSTAVIEQNSIDVAGLQEVRPPQLRKLKSNEFLGATYEIWPNATQRPGYEPNIVIWKKDKFELISKDFITIKYFGGADEKIPIVKLKDIETGQQFYFASTHDPADVRGEVAHLRKQNAETYVRYFNDLAKRDQDPALLVGDFNSGFKVRPGTEGNNTVGDDRNNLTYCILTRDGPFWNAYDAWKNKSGACPTSKGVSYIDHVYLTRSVNVSQFFVSPAGHSRNGSDHPTIITDVDIPGVGNGGGTDFVIGTYNLPSKKGFGPSDWQKAVNLVREKNMSIVGFQEISGRNGSNYQYLRDGLKNYGIYPDWRIPANYCANSQPIMYDKSKFSFVKAELLVYPRYDNNETDCGQGGTIRKGQSQAPIVWLTDRKTGQTIIVMNTHNAADGFGRIGEDGGRRRYEAAKIYTSKVEELRRSNPGIPIFFTGDFNEGYGVRTSRNNTYQNQESNLFFCMITNKRLMKITEDPKKTCSNNRGTGGVDFIYVTNEVGVEWHRSSSGRATTGSDHPRTPHYARVLVKATDDSKANAGSIKMGDDYARECRTMRNSGAPGLACDGQCVDFVKFRLKKHIDRQKFATIGNGKDVANNLGALGYKVNKTPAVNSVASWPAGGVAGSGANSTYGHTAMVSKVSPGEYIIVEEYNATRPAETYSTRKIPWSVALKLTYAHTEKDF